MLNNHITYGQCYSAIMSIESLEDAQKVEMMCRFKKRYWRNPCNFKKTPIVRASEKMIRKFSKNTEIAKILFQFTSDSDRTYWFFDENWEFFWSKSYYKTTMKIRNSLK